MTVFQALILGVVQGLTEFLPVSSSGHLVLLQRIMNINLGGADMFFDLTLHLGTLFAVCVTFRKQILALFRRPFKRLLYFVAASVPAAAAGLLFGDVIDAAFSGGLSLTFGFAVSAVLLAAAQVRAKRAQNLLPLRLRCALSMGIAQAVAVIPGISRSGATVAAGMFAGGSREEVADFSFLMSIPVILGGFAVTLLKGFSSGEISQIFTASGSSLGVSVAVSVAASAAAGFAAIKVMLGAVKRARYTPFVIYLAVLAIVCAALVFVGIL